MSAMGRHSSGLKAGVPSSDRGDGVHVLVFPAVAWESMTQTFEGPQRFGRSQANRLGILSQKDSISPFLKYSYYMLIIFLLVVLGKLYDTPYA